MGHFRSDTPKLVVREVIINREDWDDASDRHLEDALREAIIVQVLKVRAPAFEAK